jgi:hypothetical protein
MEHDLSNAYDAGYEDSPRGRDNLTIVGFII